MRSMRVREQLGRHIGYGTERLERLFELYTKMAAK